MLKHVNIPAIISGVFVTFAIDLILNIFHPFSHDVGIYWYIASSVGGITTGFIAKRRGFVNGLIALIIASIIPEAAGLSASLYSLATATPEFKQSALLIVQSFFKIENIFNDIILSGFLGGLGGIFGMWISKNNE